METFKRILPKNERISLNSPQVKNPLELSDLHVINAHFQDVLERTAPGFSLKEALQKIGSLIKFESAAVFIMEGEPAVLRCAASTGMSLCEVKAAELHANREFRETARIASAPMQIPNDQIPLQSRCLRSGEVLVAPLHCGDTFLGILQLFGSPRSPYKENDVRLTALVANQIALVLENRALRTAVRTGLHETLMEQADIPLFSVACDGRFLHVNQAMLDLLGVSRSEALNDMNFFSHVLQPKNSAARIRRLFARGESLTDVEVMVWRSDGSSLTVLVSSLPVKDESRRILGHEGILKDITAKKSTADQLMQCQKMASLGQLTCNIAHDFNNLIGGIMGCATMMLSQVEDGHPLAEDARTIISASRKASDLARHLLDYARRDSNRTESLSLNMLIEETVHMLSRTFGKEIGIQMALDPDLVPVEADATRIQQAILNICLNARDAMPRGGLLFIETANAALDESEAGRFGVSPGAYARTRIRDTGCGMDAKTLSRIFEPFFTTKGKADGNGLGLAIAMEIVRQHGGGIGVTSRPGEGSSFELVLPVTAGRKASQEIIREAKVLPRGHETLLLVDDEEVIRRMGKRMLERFGYRVLMAKDGEDALRLVRRSDTDIDLLILDKVMPAMDGTETLKQIQKIKPGIRALLTSGFWSGDATETSRKQGFCGFIPKPFLVGQVLNLIRQSLDGPIPLMPQ